jgi:biopolymer transport protein ExbD
MSRNKNEEEGEAQVSVLPVMNVMFLLIPALLLAMEAASMAQITVETPSGCNLKTDDAPTTNPLKLEVTVLEDGFRTSYAGSEEAVGGPDIPLANDGTHDYAALEAKARALKAAYPDEFTVTVSAENDVELHQIVGTMDALRGTGCKHAGSDAPGAENCMFWQPSMQSMI